jgi:hypothetical protein
MNLSEAEIQVLASIEEALSNGLTASRKLWRRGTRRNLSGGFLLLLQDSDTSDRRQVGRSRSGMTPGYSAASNSGTASNKSATSP